MTAVVRKGPHVDLVGSPFGIRVGSAKANAKLESTPGLDEARLDSIESCIGSAKTKLARIHRIHAALSR